MNMQLFDKNKKKGGICIGIRCVTQAYLSLFIVTRNSEHAGLS
jgi:hypothetical protein